MTHLSRDDLVRWRDEGLARDRNEVISHLAACEACRRQLADLVRLEPAAESTGLDPRRFVTRGLAAYKGSRHSWWQRPVLWGPLSAAAAAALVFVLVRPMPPPPAEPPLDVRSSEIVPIFPAGDVDRISEFRWSSPYAASRFELMVRDVDGSVLLTRFAPDERLDVSSDPAFLLRPGRYSWSVRALDSSAREIATSRSQAFTVR